MQYQVPQFIDVEDKIVGPLTIKQFIFVGIGGALILVFFFTLRLAFAIILSIPVAAISASLAFVTIKGMPLYKYLAAMAGFAFKPQEYTWKKEVKKPESS